MKTQLPQDVVDFGRASRACFAALGSDSFSGAQFALAAENDVTLRELTGTALEQLGAFDIDPMADAHQLLAACELSRVAGSVALPYPVAERLLARADAWCALIDERTPFVDHGELHDTWVGVALDGSLHSLSIVNGHAKRKLAPFVRPASVVAPVPGGQRRVAAIHLVLGAWRVLGTLEAAIEQVSAHVQARVQFGKPLAEFQAVRFSLADAVVTVRGLSELARYTAWRQVGGEQTALADALALRIYAADGARSVLRTCHQLLGAVGFCDEHDVSVLDRHIQSTTRLPMPAEALVERLIPSVADERFETLFTTGAS